MPSAKLVLGKNLSAIDFRLACLFSKTISTGHLNQAAERARGELSHSTAERGRSVFFEVIFILLEFRYWGFYCFFCWCLSAIAKSLFGRALPLPLRR